MGLVNLDTDDIRLDALLATYYNVKRKEDNFKETIELDSFDVDTAKEKVKESVEILSHKESYRPLIVEVLDILDQNKYEFLVEQHKYISFYWSGIPVLQLVMDVEADHGRELHISLQKYKKEKDQLIKEKKTNIFTYGAIGSLVFVSGLAVGLSWFKSGGED